ncbi:MAG TPA: Gfo/Idh/MocA family oxidoreductase [Pseudolabrys sp.]|jgi:predicted dehydrogenase
MSQKTKVGVVGIGWWSDVLADAVVGSDEIEIVAGYSRSVEKTRAFAQKYSCRAASSLEEMLAMPDLQGVVVTTPNNAHLDVVKLAAAAGKHLFVEKPIAVSIAEGEEIAEICRRASVLLSIGHSYRRHTGIRRIKRLIEEGALGRVSYADGIFSKGRGLGLVSGGDWRSQDAVMPGGCLMQIGIHHIDNLIYLLGPVVDVSAMLARLETRAEIFDIGSVHLRFESGAIGTVTANYISADRFALNVYGTKAAVRFDLQDGLEWLPAGERAWRRIEVEPNDFLCAEMEEFAVCIREGRRPEVGGEEGLVPLAVIHAAIRSQTEHRVVALKEILPSQNARVMAI